MDNNIQIDYPAPLKALKEVALELKLNQDILDRLESFPENESDLDRAQVEELLSIAEMIFNKAEEHKQEHKVEFSDISRKLIAMYEGRIIRNKTKDSADG